MWVSFTFGCMFGLGHLADKKQGCECVMIKGLGLDCRGLSMCVAVCQEGRHILFVTRHTQRYTRYTMFYSLVYSVQS